MRCFFECHHSYFPGMTIEQPVVLDVGPKEFSIGLSYTGSSRTRDFTNLAFDPMPSFNRILKEKEVEVKRRAKEIGRREVEAAVLGLGGEEMEVQEGEVQCTSRGRSLERCRYIHTPERSSGV